MSASKSTAAFTVAVSFALIVSSCFSDSQVVRLDLGGTSASVAPSNLVGAGQSVVTVDLQSSNGTPVVGSITQVSVDGCDVTQPTSPTRANGTADATVVSCSTPGQHLVSVEVTQGASQVSVPVAATLKSVKPATANGNDVQAGFPLNAQVVVSLPNGARNTGYTGTVHFACTDSAAVLPPDYTFTGKENGVKVWQDAVTLRTAGSQTITAVDTVTAQEVLHETYIVTPGPAGALAISQAPSSLQAGVPFQITITATDSTGATLGGYTGSVGFVSSDAAAVLPDPVPFLPSDAGKKTFTLILKTAGTQSLQATDGHIASVAQSFTVQANLVAKLRVVAPAQFVAGVGQPVTVQSTDAYGNVVPTYSGTVHFSSSDPNIDLTSADPNVRSLPVDTPFDQAGQGTMVFPRVALVTAGSQSLTVTDAQDSNFAYTQTGIKVVGGSAINWTVATDGAPWVAGQPLTVTVTALDTYNNPASLYRGIIKMTATDPNASLPANYTFTANDMGVKTYTHAVTWVHSGNQTLSATDFVARRGGAVAGMVVPNAVASFRLSNYNNPAYVAHNSNVTLSAIDGWGNVNPNFTGTVHFTSTDPNALLPGDASIVSGGVVTTGSVKFANYGPRQLQVVNLQNPNLVGNANIAVHQIQSLVSNTSLSTCAIVDSGQLRCWGQNSAGASNCPACAGGQLGLGDTIDRGADPQSMGAYLPNVQLGSGRTVLKVGGGVSHRCVILDDHSVKCWGDNGVGQLGLGNSSSYGDKPGAVGDALPTVNLGAGRTAYQIWGGRSSTCVKMDNAQVLCWGYNADGELGLGDPNDRGNTPDSMQNLPTLNLGTGRTVMSMGVGEWHLCAVLDDATVKCWGYNGEGLLGLGDKLSRGNQPNQMGDNLPTVDLGSGRTGLMMTAGINHTCALLDNHQVKCWGQGSNGCLGYENDTDLGDDPGEMGDNLPYVNLGTDRTATFLMAGLVHNCALLDNGSIKCWGQNSDGRLGTGDARYYGLSANSMGDYLPAVNLPTGRTVLQVMTAAYHTCVRLNDGLGYCWGDNQQGQMGLASGITGDIGFNPSDLGDNLKSIQLW